ncbi:MAG: hypothetical protein Q8R69_15800 [Telluria sp.]|nr:hypothetical protein [Telluria sp.]
MCAKSRAPAEADRALLQRLGGLFAAEAISVFKGSGCDSCHGSGFKGRLGLYEVLSLDAHLRHLIATSAPITDITSYAREQAFLTLREDAFAKVRDGKTTLEEVFRVLGPE